MLKEISKDFIFVLIFSLVNAIWKIGGFPSSINSLAAYRKLEFVDNFFMNHFFFVFLNNINFFYLSSRNCLMVTISEFLNAFHRIK